MRGAAIRPVPSYAVIVITVLEQVEDELGSERAKEELDAAFVRFERTQPHLAGLVSDVLGRQLDEIALSLGYFLSIAVWLGFERAFRDRLRIVDEDALKATEAALLLEEELRASQADEPIELDDVIAQEQPGILEFINAHVEAALEGSEGAAERDVDVDDVHLVDRTILILTLALSHAVAPEGGDAGATPEMQA